MEGKIFILNFGHRLAPDVIKSLEPCVELYYPLSLNMESDSMIQVIEKVAAIAKQVEEMDGRLDGTVPIVVALPGISEGVALVLAELLGRLGELPKVLRLRRRENGTYGLFGGDIENGVFDLEKYRRSARGRR